MRSTIPNIVALAPMPSPSVAEILPQVLEPAGATRPLAALGIERHQRPARGTQIPEAAARLEPRGVRPHAEALQPGRLRIEMELELGFHLPLHRRGPDHHADEEPAPRGSDSLARRRCDAGGAGHRED